VGVSGLSCRLGAASACRAPVRHRAPHPRAVCLAQVCRTHSTGYHQRLHAAWSPGRGPSRRRRRTASRARLGVDDADENEPEQDENVPENDVDATPADTDALASDGEADNKQEDTLDGAEASQEVQVPEEPPAKPAPPARKTRATQAEVRAARKAAEAAGTENLDIDEQIKQYLEPDTDDTLAVTGALCAE
jgi:hypothetical protein